MDWPLKPQKREAGSDRRSKAPRQTYRPPLHASRIPLRMILERTGKEQLERLSPAKGAELHYSGDLSLLKGPTVAIVGTRKPSDEGRARARRLAKELVGAGVTIMSGLARGVDTEALKSAISHGGKTIAVIGTPLSKAYPAENARLQEEIYQHHLLVSPFAEGEPVFKSNFPKRNRIMAALSAATVIVEAGETSGTLHQAVECQRLGRWLFIAKAVADNPALEWPARFVGKPKTAILCRTEDVIAAIGHGDA